MLVQIIHDKSPPIHTLKHHIFLRSFSLIFTLVSLLHLIACEPNQQNSSCNEAQSRNPLDACYEPCEDGNCENSIPVARSLDCIDSDGALCLLAFTWQDTALRRGAITPGEEVSLDTIVLANSSNTSISLDALVVSAETSLITLATPSETILSPSGSDATEEEMHRTSNPCSRGIIPPSESCRFSISTDFTIESEAPVDQKQSLLLSLRYSTSGQNNHASLSIPFLVINSDIGLELDHVELENSTQDEAINPGDRLRFSEIDLLNQSLSAFENLEVQVSTRSSWVRFEERGEMWSDGDEVSSGPVSTTLVTCPPATISAVEGDTERMPGRCTLEIPNLFFVAPDTPIGEELNFDIRFKSHNEQLLERFTVSYQVEPLDIAIRFDELILTNDQNQDGLVSPGEQVTFTQLAIFNEGSSGVSLHGRISVVDEGADLLSGSDTSVDFTNQNEDFFEYCPPAQACLTSIRLRLRTAFDLTENDQVTLKLELLDQMGQHHELFWQFDISVPTVELELSELRITQDSLDQRLSGGERGLISYLKLINQGDADAIGLHGVLWTDSPYIIGPQDAQGKVSWPLALREMGQGIDTTEESAQGRCVSLIHDESAYCYQRLELNFEVSLDAPIGEEITFWIDLSDEFGQIYQLSHHFQLF